MNKDAILKYQIYSAIFAIILGTLLHFTYEWSNYNALIGTFSSVNESTWEHLKLAFFPMLITTIIGFFKFKNVPNFLCSKIIDILSFMFSVILGEYVSYKKIMSDFKGNTLVCILILVVLSFCFIIFTYNPPKIQLFQDPLTGLYGMF